jgi:hypothetical protein
MQNFIIDNNKGRIEFLDNRFYLTGDGGYVPSVTTILEAYPKDASYYKWLKDVGQDADTIRDEAGRRGSIVHELTEKYDMGEEVSFITESGGPKFKMLEWSMFERWVDFTNRYNPTIEMMECNMISSKLGFAGTLDRVIDLDGKKILLDIKTSNSIYPSYWLQLSAYAKLLKEVANDAKAIDTVGILWLNAKTRTEGKKGAVQGIGWQLVTKTIEEAEADWELFQATHKLWLAMNEDVKPKQISYQLKHKK